MAITGNEKRVIERFLTTYNAFEGVELQVIAWPDEVDRSGKAIDAIAADGTTRIAIEHTLLQPFVGERDESAIFLKTVGMLDQKPTLKIEGYSVTLTFGVGAVPKRVDWTSVAPAVENWYLSTAPTLPDGETRHTVPGLPFALDVHVAKVAIPGRADLFIDRWMPPESLDGVIAKAVADKLPKLLATAADEHVLLLEKNTIARGYGEITESLRATHPNMPELSQVSVWVIDTIALESEDYGPSYLVWPEDAAHEFDEYRRAKDDG